MWSTAWQVDPQPCRGASGRTGAALGNIRPIQLMSVIHHHPGDMRRLTCDRHHHFLSVSLLQCRDGAVSR